MGLETTLGRGPTAARLVALLTSTPGQEFHTRELVRRIGGTERPVHQALVRLERKGLLESRRIGNLRLWRAVEGHPLYRPLRELTARTVGVAARLRAALSKRPGIELAFVFGSYAKGDDDASSDIDLFVLGDAERRELDKAASAVLHELGREVRTVAYQPGDLEARWRKGSPFLKRIFADPKVWLIGGDDDLDRRLRALGGALPRGRSTRPSHGGRVTQARPRPPEPRERTSAPRRRRR